MHHPFAIFEDWAIEAEPDHLEGFAPGAAAPRRGSRDAGRFCVRLLGNLTTDGVEIIPGCWLIGGNAGSFEQIFAIEEGEGATTRQTDHLAAHFSETLEHL